MIWASYKHIIQKKQNKTNKKLIVTSCFFFFVPVVYNHMKCCLFCVKHLVEVQQLLNYKYSHINVDIKTILNVRTLIRIILRVLKNYGNRSS